MFPVYLPDSSHHVGKFCFDASQDDIDNQGRCKGTGHFGKVRVLGGIKGLLLLFFLFSSSSLLSLSPLAHYLPVAPGDSTGEAQGRASPIHRDVNITKSIRPVFPIRTDVETLLSRRSDLEHTHYPNVPSCHVILYVYGFRQRGVGVVEDIRHSLKRHSAFHWSLGDSDPSISRDKSVQFIASLIKFPVRGKLNLTLDAACRRSYPRICLDRGISGLGSIIAANNELLSTQCTQCTQDIHRDQGRKFRPATQFRLNARSYNILGTYLGTSGMIVGGPRLVCRFPRTRHLS
ncbi:hypothetical protein PCH_Pc22g14910 [Penicillium rubens Wisconsin 54-1255]|uniref:Uncharacterized protein n=1 Tax=Penicillium rubens (strain ATCC 28089 / DSM 1075 / NRRL 1951 / Wisconsin 54-1255) TaxID=500485 RepID=B6HVC7_PENRW|nr:hypothetical protein PCH_Pc22g14910 [Penicillium rubens Wisconsin 54-1255]